MRCGYFILLCIFCFETDIARICINNHTLVGNCKAQVSPKNRFTFVYLVSYLSFCHEKAIEALYELA